MNLLKNHFPKDRQMRRGGGFRRLGARSLRGESLEDRLLLSLTAVDYEGIRSAYSDLVLASSLEDVHVIELETLTAESLQAAVRVAEETPFDDLIAIRTESGADSIVMGETPISIGLSEESGRLTIAVYGESSLKLIGGDSVIHVTSGEVALGGVTLIHYAEGTEEITPTSLVTLEDGASLETSRVLYQLRRATGANPEDVVVSVEFRVKGTEWAYRTGLSVTEAVDYETTIYQTGASSFYVGVYYDVNKVWSGDSQLCWGAVTANILYYTGWSESILHWERPEDIYDYIRRNFSNVGGHAYYALEWFFTGDYSVEGVSGWAQPNPGSGGFYPEVDFESVCDYLGPSQTLLYQTANSLKRGYGAAIALGWYQKNAPTNRTGGHSVTLWGYYYDSSKIILDPEYYTGLIITNSDDRKDQTINVSLEWNPESQMYRLADFSSGTGWIEDITLLAPSSKVTLSTPTLDVVVADRFVTLTWDPVDDAMGYRVEYWEEGGTEVETLTVDRDEISIDIFGLASETAYEFRIQAIGEGHFLDSDWSASSLVVTVDPLLVTIALDRVDPSDGWISLREAITYAQAGDRITFDASLAGDVIELDSALGELTITDTLTIDALSLRNEGTGSEGVTIDALGGSRVFSISGGTESDPVTLRGLTITGGWSDFCGGGIFLTGVLTIESSSLVGNHAVYGGGIEIQNRTGETGTLLRMTDSFVRENVAIGGGGGVSLSGTDSFGGGTVLIEKSIISGNRVVSEGLASGCGGGFYLGVESVRVSVVNSLVNGNEAELGGGFFVTEGAGLSFVNSTVAGNVGSYGGGGFLFGDLTFRNSIFALNRASEGDADLYRDSSGTVDALFTLSGSPIGEAVFIYDEGFPLFTDLENGDFTLSADSQAIDRGDSSFALDVDGEPLMTDLAGNDRIFGQEVDLGAYESNESSPLLPLESPAPLLASSGSEAVRVLWGEISGADGYRVDWFTDRENVGTLTTLETTVRLTGLPNGEMVHVRVTALGNGVTTSDSASAVESIFLCPMDVDSDGVIGPSDITLLSSAWLSRSGKDNWDERCDVDGDGFVSGTDLTFLSVNWLRRSSATDLIYPGSRGPIPVGFVSDSVFDLAGEDFDDDFLSIDFLL